VAGENLIGGIYKDVEAANAGIPELQKQIASLQSERDTVRNELTAAKTPRQPAFKDDSGMMEHFKAKNVNLAEIGTKIIGDKFDPNDMKAIGEAIKEADPEWLGKTFAQLHRHRTLTTIESGQQKVMKEIGGEANLKKMIEWQDKNGTPEQKAAWAQEWHGLDDKARQSAAERLAGRFALKGGGTSSGASETSTVASGGGGGDKGGFANRNEWLVAKNASRAKHGSDYLKLDTEFSQRYASTPNEVRATFTT
jgi:hypothetical protein